MAGALSGGGERALQDRSSAPARSPRRPAPRAQPRSSACAAALDRAADRRRLGMPVATVGLVLRRLGLGRLVALEPRPPVIRYERDGRGELLHLDTKKLGRIDGLGHRITGNRRDTRRGAGWEFLHVAIDDAAASPTPRSCPTSARRDASAFLNRALAWFGGHGVTVERVMTDNGSAYRSHAFRRACAAAGLRHMRTRPYTPRTNGKAERFIQTALREWAYARPYPAPPSAATPSTPGSPLQPPPPPLRHRRPHPLRSTEQPPWKRHLVRPRHPTSHRLPSPPELPARRRSLRSVAMTTICHIRSQRVDCGPKKAILQVGTSRRVARC